MELLFRLLLFIVGIVNLVPSILAFFPERISKSYGIAVSNPNYELLLRHRAILFGVIGGLMVYAAITRKLYATSVLVGLVSMISFVLLYFVIGNINEELDKVMKIDLVAIILVVIGYTIYKLKT